MQHDPYCCALEILVIFHSDRKLFSDVLDGYKLAWVTTVNADLCSELTYNVTFLHVHDIVEAQKTVS